MRTFIMRRHVRLLKRTGFAVLIAASATACSSDFTRFDRNLYSDLPGGAQQQPAAANNPYPADVDPTTTASIARGAPHPAATVAPAVGQPDHAGYQPIANVNNQPIRLNNRMNGAVSTNYGSQTAGSVAAARAAPTYNSGVIKRSLPNPVSGPAGLPSARAPKVDPVNTGSIAQAATSLPKPSLSSAAAAGQAVGGQAVGGWNRTGGTAITLRSGETLYNVSKRYGVPVAAIMKANGISNANEVQAGRQIVVPTYVYSRSAPVSAPDNDPLTRASRATTGLAGQAMPGRIAIPQHNPREMAALNNNSSLNAQREQIDQRYAPKPLTRDHNANTSVPDYSIVTGSVSRTVPMDGLYTVKSGDSLSAIAVRTGTTVKALMDANGLDNSNIRVGQTLQLPAAANQPAAAQQVARNAPVQGPKAYVKPSLDQTVTNSVSAKAPERTGIKNLRWPVSGRIISGFGDKRRSGPNDGIDISVPEGTTVRAAENGVVIYSGNDLEGFGNLILIRHADGFVTAYAHNKANHVKKGAQVKRGQQIAASGRSGSATVPMLHFEVRKNARPVNPEKYLGG